MLPTKPNPQYSQVRYRIQPKHIIIFFLCSLLFFIFSLLFVRLQNQIHLDSIRPNLTLLGDNPATACSSQSYNEAGYIATDYTGQDITNQVARQIFPDYIEYQVSDPAGHPYAIRRKIIPPSTNRISLQLNGPTTTQIPLHGSYNDPGATATDLCDGDISDRISATALNTDQTGQQTITYQIEDPNSHATLFVQRRINIIDLPQNGQGVIYLTFDDGPSSITPRILEILAQNNIKATFFLINHPASYDYLISNIYQAGHSIGLHSYSHNYAQIYSSEAAFFADLAAIQDKIFQLTGYRSMLYRFPGGSSNTISRFNPGIISRLSTELHQRGFTYFDWNVSGEDAGSAKDAFTIYQNVVQNLSTNRPNIVLLHDSAGKTATAEALGLIIEYANTHGYSFAPITDTTPVITHPINN